MRATLLILLVAFTAFDATAPLFAQSKRDADGEIVVTGSRRARKFKDSVVNVEVIRRDDLEKEGARNAADALANVPGIEIRPAQPGQRGEIVRLQGLDTRHVLILINGDRITGRFDGGIDLTRIKVEEIERIEVIKGSTSALYGSDAIGGVINIITREPTKPMEGDFSARYGSGRELHYGSGGEAHVNSRLAFRGERVASSFYTGWHRGDGFDLSPDASPGPRSDRIESQSDVYDPSRRNLTRSQKLGAIVFELDDEIEDEPQENTTGNAFRDLTTGNNSTFYLTPGTKLKTNLNYRYLEQDGVDTSPPRAVYDRHTETHDYMVGIGPVIEFDRGEFTAKYSYARFLDTYTQDQRGADELDRKDVTDDQVSELRTQLGYQIHRDHYITVGADGLLEELSSPRIGLPCQVNPPNLCIHEELDIPPARVNGNARRGRGAVFVQDEWILMDAPRLYITPGLRHENDSDFGAETMPRLALRLDPYEKLKLRFAVGRGFRAPSFKELYFNFQNPGAGYQVVGNEDLEPERSLSVNGGAEWDAARWLWLSFSLYHNKIENLIDFRRQPGVDEDGLITFETSNYKRALTQGVETSVSFRFELKAHDLRLDLGYAYTNARNLDTGLPLEGRAPHRGTFRLNYEYVPARIGFRLFGSVFGKQPFYCEKAPVHCVDLEYVDEDYAFNRESDYLLDYLDADTIELCNAFELRACGSEADLGFTMENPYNLVNLRVFKKWGNLEFFAGVDNMLDEYDLQYNLIQPRFFYAGLTASLDALGGKDIGRIRKSAEFQNYKESDTYRRYQQSPRYRKLKERREVEEFNDFRRFQESDGQSGSSEKRGATPAVEPIPTTENTNEDEIEIIEE